MFDVIIIGAGIIGCAAARELSKYDIRVCVVEKCDDVACGTTKANSAIVHAGFDAKSGTLKAILNVKGSAMFESWAKELDFPFKRIGSLVLCFDKNDIEKLEELKKQGIKNGVQGLKVLNADETREIEPSVTDEVVGVLYAPTGGITCPYEMTIACAENAYTNDVEFKFDTEVKGISKDGDLFVLNTNKEQLKCKIIINAAGVFADNINNMISSSKLHIIPRKGQYFLFDKAAGKTAAHTIFQLPTKMGKGVLVTPTVDGNLLVGPTAEDIKDKLDVNTTMNAMNELVLKAQKSIKTVPMNQIITSFSGLRAHIDEDDFIIGESDVENFINAAGVESPGLSSAPAIAEMLCEIIVNKIVPKEKENFNPIRKGIPKFREMSNEERNKLIAENPQYGRIICRCETVTEGEIVNSIRRPLGAKSIDGIKRRTRAGMGRCQSGFCLTKVVDILARELSIPRTEITKFGGKSKLLVGKNKDLIV